MGIVGGAPAAGVVIALELGVDDALATGGATLELGSGARCAGATSTPAALSPDSPGAAAEVSTSIPSPKPPNATSAIPPAPSNPSSSSTGVRLDLGISAPASRATILLGKLAGERLVSFRVDAARALLSHDWPLNIRELEQTLTTAVALCRDGEIELERLPKALKKGPPSSGTEAEGATGPLAASGAEPKRHLGAEDEAIRHRLETLLAAHAGNVSAVAREMGKDRRQVHRWVQRASG